MECRFVDALERLIIQNNGKILHLLRDFVQVDAESGPVIPDGQDLRSISLHRPTLTEVALESCCQGSGQTEICVGSGGLSRHLSKNRYAIKNLFKSCVI